MPNYDFRCKDCGEAFSKRVSWSEKEKVVCPKCEGKTKQLFTGFGMIKGAGSGSTGSDCGPVGSPFG